MSGGAFNYDQNKIGYIADKIERVIRNNKIPIKDKDRNNFWSTQEYYYNYSDDIIEEFKIGLDYLRIAQIYAQRIDWLISDDDGEISFKKRLQEELEKYNQKKLLIDVMQADEDDELYYD